MDYQQATKSWFIGFMEGEGCFCRRRTGLVEISISNKEVDVLYSCKDFLARNHILSYLNTNRRGISILSIGAKQDCKMLYDLVKDAMQCRIDELEEALGASTTTRETSCDSEWLRGAYEAGSCFTISTQRHRGERVSHKPEVMITNTNMKFIEKAAKTLHALQLSWYTSEKIPAEGKPSKELRIVGFKRVIRFLRAMGVGWIGRKTQRKVRLLQEYCRSRLSKPEKEPYSEREHQIAHEIKMKI